ncbi:hypothetical protein ONZ45_g17955 [Pleurotus djamor]|nr:hypothetical protein ONZ45_g17955 [Pleurotus djamor]
MPLRYAVVMYGLHLVDLADSLNPSSHLLLRRLPPPPPRTIIRLCHQGLSSWNVSGPMPMTPSPWVCHIPMAGRRVKHPWTVVAPLRSPVSLCESLLDRHQPPPLLVLPLITRASTILFDYLCIWCCDLYFIVTGPSCFVLHAPPVLSTSDRCLTTRTRKTVTSDTEPYANSIPITVLVQVNVAAHHLSPSGTARESLHYQSAFLVVLVPTPPRPRHQPPRMITALAEVAVITLHALPSRMRHQTGSTLPATISPGITSIARTTIPSAHGSTLDRATNHLQDQPLARSYNHALYVITAMLSS